MKVAESFSLDHLSDAVWGALEQPLALAQCLPGARIEEVVAHDHLRGVLEVRLGPIVAAFRGDVHVHYDAPARRGSVVADAVDGRTGTRVRSTMGFVLEAAEAGSTVRMETEVALMGSLAQFARRTLMQQVASRLTRAFAANLAARLDEDAAGPGG